MYGIRATALRELGHKEKAIANLNKYLAPDSPNRAQVEQRLQELRGQ
jgi:hypothetical protein